MLLIISAFIEFIFYILIFVFIPKKKYYEYYYMNQQYNKNSRYSYFECDDYCLYFEEQLKSSKNVNQALLSFIIILFIFVILRIILAIYHKNKGDKECIITIIKVTAVFSFWLIILSWILSLAIVDPVNKLRKDDGDKFGVTDPIKKGIVKVILILTPDLLVGLTEAVASYYYETKSTYYSSSYSPTVRVTYSNTNNNNYNVTTTRTNVIVVRHERQYLVSLKRVLSNEVYSNLKASIEKGQLLMMALIKFYKDMRFEGFTEEKTITGEITSLIVILSSLLDKMGDPVSHILLEYSEDHDAIALLVQYIFPLIVRVIKLNIERGKYRRFQRTINEQIVVLTQLERTVERDENGNVTQTFRFRQQVSQASLANILG